MCEVVCDNFMLLSLLPQPHTVSSGTVRSQGAGGRKGVRKEILDDENIKGLSENEESDKNIEAAIACSDVPCCQEISLDLGIRKLLQRAIPNVKVTNTLR